MSTHPRGVDRLLAALARLEACGALDDPWGRSIKEAVLGGFALPSDLEELHRRHARLARSELLGDACPFRTPRLPGGGVCLGRDPSGSWVHADLTSAVTHWACIGSTGSGKTSAWFWLLAQLLLRGVGFVGIECSKRDLRSLLPIARRCGRSLSVLAPRDLKWNPLEPDGVAPARHLQSTLSLIGRAIDLPERASMLLRRVCHELYAESGVLSGRLDRCPTLLHVFERARACDANAAAREALLDRLGSLLLSLGPEVLAYHRAWRPSQFLDRLTVLELAGSGEQVRQWLPAAWLGTMFHGRIEAGAQNAALRTLCLIDDAQRFLGGDGIGTRDMTPIGELLGLLRTTGIAVAANYQSLEGVPSGTLANMTGRIVGRLGVAQDWRRIASECGLDPRQLAWAQDHLRPGRYLVHMPISPWRQPFIVDVPRPRLPTVTEEELSEGRRELTSLPLVPAAGFAGWSLWRGGQARTEAAAAPASPNAGASADPKNGVGTPAAERPLSDHEARLLLAVVDRPFQPASSYHKACGISPAAAKRARGSLIERGLIHAHKARLKLRGRQPLLLAPTERGRMHADAMR